MKKEIQKVKELYHNTDAALETLFKGMEEDRDLLFKVADLLINIRSQIGDLHLDLSWEEKKRSGVWVESLFSGK